MASRFYLPSSGAADVSPGFDATWEQTGTADRIKMTNKDVTNVTALTGKTSTYATGVAQDILTRQYVSSPLAFAYAFDGTISFICGTSDAAAGLSNSKLSILVKVVSNDGGTSSGTILSAFSKDTGIPNALALTPLISQAGDRIVVEVGGTTTGPTGTQTVTHRLGNSATSDFALTSGLTTDLNPWIQFSQNILTKPTIQPLRPHIFQGGIAR